MGILHLVLGYPERGAAEGAVLVYSGFDAKAAKQALEREDPGIGFKEMFRRPIASGRKAFVVVPAEPVAVEPVPVTEEGVVLADEPAEPEE